MKPMARSPQPLSKVIATDAKLAAWQARRAREEALTGLVRRHLPRQLGDRMRASAAGQGQLELVASAGAVAAALRQRLPDLLATLQREGLDCSGIRVRVQVGRTRDVAPKALRNQIDKTAAAPLASLAADLPPGPLKAALARLLRRAG